MSDPTEARRARVLRVVAAGRRVADRGDPLGREARTALPAASGLSPEGVELALTAHLETDVAPHDLDALLASAGEAPRCHVVLSANVCTAALRAIAVATATAPAVVVRPSRRDPVLAGLLVRALGADEAFAAAGGTIALAPAVAPAPGEELHLYGSDEAIAAIEEGVGPGVVVRAHGTGLGVAVVGGAVDLVEAAEAVARDVVPFDQRGCLSPRAVLVEGDAARAAAFADALHRALCALGTMVPRGPVDADIAAQVAMYRATIEAVGVLHAGADHVVGLDPAPRALVLPPAARVVHVVPADAGSGPVLLAPWADHVTSVGACGEGEGLARAVELMARRARRAALGAMQRPPLDGPVDLRRRGRAGVTCPG